MFGGLLKGHGTREHCVNLDDWRLRWRWGYRLMQPLRGLAALYLRDAIRLGARFWHAVRDEHSGSVRIEAYVPKTFLAEAPADTVPRAQPLTTVPAEAEIELRTLLGAEPERVWLDFVGLPAELCDPLFACVRSLASMKAGETAGVLPLWYGGKRVDAPLWTPEPDDLWLAFPPGVRGAGVRAPRV
jgi:hypothetical protein